MEDKKIKNKKIKNKKILNILLYFVFVILMNVLGAWPVSMPVRTMLLE